MLLPVVLVFSTLSMMVSLEPSGRILSVSRSRSRMFFLDGFPELVAGSVLDARRGDVAAAGEGECVEVAAVGLAGPGRGYLGVGGHRAGDLAAEVYIVDSVGAQEW